MNIMDVVSSPKSPHVAQLRVLVVDDEKNIRVTLAAYLEGMGCRVMAVATAGAALSALESQTFDLAFLDLRLKEMSSLELLPKLLSISPRLSVVIITAYATIETAVEAMKRGARDYLPKPFTPAQISHLVEGLAERLHLSRQVEELQAHLREAVPDVVLETESPKMRATLDLVEKVAPAEIPVLLLGENGTGKGVIARGLHAQSHRARVLRGYQLSDPRNSWPASVRPRKRALPVPGRKVVGGPKAARFLDEVARSSGTQPSC
jgi:NtrC-family two-component system response regulator AlgB